MKKTLKVLGIIGLVLLALAIVAGLFVATGYTYSVVGSATWIALGAGLVVCGIVFLIAYKTRNK